MTDLIDEKVAKSAVQRQRSPGYPQIGLQRCLELVRKVYEGAHTGEVDSATLVGLLGYSSVSGQGLSAASAVKKFGLIEGRGEKLKVSSLALKILEPMSGEERQAAVKEAAMKPELYSEVLTRFGGKIPSDEVMRSFLIRSYEFAPTGADNFIKAFRETIDSIAAPSINPLLSTNENLSQEVPQPPQQSVDLKSEVVTQAAPREFAQEGEKLTFRISPTAKVHVLFEGEITPTAIEKLIKFLELSKDSYQVKDIWDQ